jgi:phosphatidylinositol alpha 1,6-mannosyltransferase
MRVAIITESFPPDVNGVAHCVLRVAELLTSHGHHPLVIAPQPPKAKRDEGASYPFPVVRVPAVPLPGYPGFRLGLPAGGSGPRSSGTGPSWCTWPAPWSRGRTGPTCPRV